jgi:hypothetical protein
MTQSISRVEMRSCEGAAGGLGSLNGIREVFAREMSSPAVVETLATLNNGVRRVVDDLVVTPFELPNGCVGGYYPDVNPLAPLSRRDEASNTPAPKCVPVRIETKDPSA